MLQTETMINGSCCGAWDVGVFSVRDSPGCGKGCSVPAGPGCSHIYIPDDTPIVIYLGTDLRTTARRKLQTSVLVCHGWFRHISIVVISISGAFCNRAVRQFPRRQRLPSSPCFHTNRAFQTLHLFAASKRLVEKEPEYWICLHCGDFCAKA